MVSYEKEGETENKEQENIAHVRRRRKRDGRQRKGKYCSHKKRNKTNRRQRTGKPYTHNIKKQIKQRTKNKNRAVTLPLPPFLLFPIRTHYMNAGGGEGRKVREGAPAGGGRVIRVLSRPLSHAPLCAGRPDTRP